MPGAESVTIELRDAVFTKPVTGKVSIASGLIVFPCE